MTNFEGFACISILSAADQVTCSNYANNIIAQCRSPAEGLFTASYLRRKEMSRHPLYCDYRVAIAGGHDWETHKICSLWGGDSEHPLYFTSLLRTQAEVLIDVNRLCMSCKSFQAEVWRHNFHSLASLFSTSINFISR